jgi:hypothetical protein
MRDKTKSGFLLAVAALAVAFSVGGASIARPQAPVSDDGKKGTGNTVDGKKAGDKAADAKKVGEKPPAVIEIEVTGGGMPLKDAVVQLRYGNGISKSSSTSSQGQAKFSEVVRGKVTIDVTGVTGFKPMHQELQIVEDHKSIPLVLEKDGH